MGVYLKAVDVPRLNDDRVPPFCENESNVHSTRLAGIETSALT